MRTEKVLDSGERVQSEWVETLERRVEKPYDDGPVVTPVLTVHLLLVCMAFVSRPYVIIYREPVFDLLECLMYEGGFYYVLGDLRFLWEASCTYLLRHTVRVPYISPTTNEGNTGRVSSFNH